MSINNRSTHDRIEAVCAEFRHKLLDAFQIVEDLFRYYHEHADPEDLQSFMEDDINRKEADSGLMIPSIAICSECTEKADVIDGDTPYCAKHWFELYGGRNGKSQRLVDRDGRGRSGHDTRGVDFQL